MGNYLPVPGALPLPEPAKGLKKKAGFISHVTKFGGGAPDYTPRLDAIFLDAHPVATMEIKYRSKELLEAMDILPLPEIEHDPEDADDDDLIIVGRKLASRRSRNDSDILIDLTDESGGPPRVTKRIKQDPNVVENLVPLEDYENLLQKVEALQKKMALRGASGSATGAGSAETVEIPDDDGDAGPSGLSDGPSRS
ncbi:hypothetical protein HDU87_000808 [Geranomyces variabilis]|uniref:Uncharacterized protein n=1 Tax=Geranomyces variabilis TaxID=109894 RepID=A0AAD5XT16_9FUNG|nr:hypothetical protein HDU87_000808 [Geranomyces variabilis]